SRRLTKAVEQLRRRLGVTMPAAAFATLLAQNIASAAPAHVVASATKAGLGAMPSAATGVGAAPIFLAALATVVAVGGAVILGMQNSPNPPPTGAVMTTAGASSNVKRQNGTVWIDGVPRLEWGKSGETTFAGALSAALVPIGPRRDYGTLM